MHMMDTHNSKSKGFIQSCYLK